MKKRILSLILALLMVLTLVPAAAFADGEELSGECGENVTWKLEDGTLTISGTGPMEDYYSHNPAPWRTYSDSVVKIVVEEGVTSTGIGAFIEMSNVTSVSLPQSLESIYSSFGQCTSLTAIDIPDGVSVIDSTAFLECTSLKTVKLPNNNTSIGAFAFMGCTALESLVIPDGVSSIDFHAFSQCTSLTTLDFPDSVSTIGSWAFNGCTSLKTVKLPNGNTSIARFAFSGCTALESIVIPEGMTEIADYVFERCTSLKEIYLPQSLCELCTSAFNYCKSLESIYYGGSLRQWKEQVEISYRDMDQESYAHGYGQATIYFADESDPFTDIDCAFHDYIVAGYAADILNGYPDNTFRPFQSVTRAQFVTMLYNMCGKPDVSGYGELEFKDTSSISSAYKDAVLWGYLGGIVSGYSDGTFRPNERISRAQMATFAYRLLKELVGEDVISQYNTDSNFTDSGSIADSYREAVNVMSTLEIINGYEDGSFRPNATATRGAAAKIIVSVYIVAAAMLEQQEV